MTPINWNTRVGALAHGGSYQSAVVAETGDDPSSAPAVL